MFCKKCGAQLQEGRSFCPMCGTNNAENAGGEQAAGNTAAENVTENPAPQPQQEAPQPQPQQTAQQTAPQSQQAATQPGVSSDTVAGFVEKLGKKKLGIILAAVVVVVLILVIAVAGGSSSGSLKIDKKASFYVGYDYFMASDGDSKEFDDIDDSYMSMDMSTVLYTDYDDDLYIVDKKLNAKKIASDVTTVRVGKDGKYVAYLCNEDNDSYSQTLYIYNVSKNKSKKIDEDVLGGSYLTISVSGKTVAYAKDYDDGEFDTYVAGYSKKATQIESKGYYPVAVSENGKRAYLLSDESTLYFYKNGKQSGDKIKDVGSSFWTNSDLSELVFSKDGDTYFCKPGKDAEKIDNSTISYIVYPYSYGTCYLGSYTQALAADTIKGQVVYTNSGKLMWVNKKASDMVKIDGDVSSIWMSEDCSSVVYVSNEKVYKVSKFKANMEPKLLYDDEDISSITASADLKKIYAYSYNDDTLYYIKSKNKAVKISEDVDNYAFNEKDGKIYYVSDEDLYSAKTSSSSSKKVSVDGDAYYVGAVLNGVVAYTSDGGEYICYYIGKKPVQVFEED
jgi:uncharacterized Zn finger protein (UPF0148 family)